MHSPRRPPAAVKISGRGRRIVLKVIGCLIKRFFNWVNVSLAFSPMLLTMATKPYSSSRSFLMKCKCLGKVEKLEKWKAKPEVDVKDKEVVDHIGVIAVLRVLVYNPGSRFIVNWRRKNRHKKVKWETWRVGGASPHWSPCWKMLLLETRSRYKREDTCVSIFQTLQDRKIVFLALILIDWTQLERCEYYKIHYSGLH